MWSNADKTHLQQLLRLQKRGARLILKHKTNDCRSSALFKELGWVNLTDRWSFHKSETVYRCLNYFCPSYLSNLFCLNSDVHNYNTRRKNDIHLAKIGSKSGERSFTLKAAKLFNSLRWSFTLILNFRSFKKINSKKYFLKRFGERK